jgi:hypothetical protein
MVTKYNIAPQYDKYQEFITSYIDNYFIGMMEQNIYATISDIEGNSIIATHKSAKTIGLNSGFELEGLSYKNIDINLVKKYCNINNIEDIEIILHLSKKLQQIRDIVVQEKITISYLDVIPYSGILEATIVNVFPIIYKTGEVILIQTIATKFHLFGIYDYLQESQQTESSHKINLCTSDELPFAIKLSPRQHEVLYLLAIGLSQDSVARILSINRGTIASIVSEQLCPKFNIAGSSTRILVSKAIELDIIKYMPKSLYKPLVLVLDPEIEKKYFNNLG